MILYWLFQCDLTDIITRFTLILYTPYLCNNQLYICYIYIHTYVSFSTEWGSLATVLVYLIAHVCRVFVCTIHKIPSCLYKGIVGVILFLYLYFNVFNGKLVYPCFNNLASFKLKGFDMPVQYSILGIHLLHIRERELLAQWWVVKLANLQLYLNAWMSRGWNRLACLICSQKDAVTDKRKVL